MLSRGRFVAVRADIRCAVLFWRLGERRLFRAGRARGICVGHFCAGLFAQQLVEAKPWLKDPDYSVATRGAGRLAWREIG